MAKLTLLGELTEFTMQELWDKRAQSSPWGSRLLQVLMASSLSPQFLFIPFFFVLSTWLTELATLTWSGDPWSLRTFAESQQSQTKL